MVDRAHFCLEDRGDQLPQTSAPDIIAHMRWSENDADPRFQSSDCSVGSSSARLARHLYRASGRGRTVASWPPVCGAAEFPAKSSTAWLGTACPFRLVIRYTNQNDMLLANLRRVLT